MPPRLESTAEFRMNRPRVADDFPTIRARLAELRRERESAQAAERELQRDSQTRRGRDVRWPPSENREGPGPVRRLGQARS